MTCNHTLSYMTSQQGHAACKRIMSLFNKETMKYTPDNHVRMILTWDGMLGFDTYKEAESAIILNEDWSSRWDCSNWKLDDLEYVHAWRKEQWAQYGEEYKSTLLLSRYASIRAIHVKH